MILPTEAKPLAPAAITFRRHREGSGPAQLVPMVDGVDIPNFHGATIQAQAGGGAVMTMTVLLPDGVVVE